MAVIPATPYVMKNFLIKIEDDDFTAAIPSCTLTPQQTLMTYKGGTPDDVWSELSTPTWQCTMRHLADWNYPASLANYLLGHFGETKTVIFQPIKLDENQSRRVTAQLVLAAPAFGGDIDAWAEVSVTHGVKGQPVFDFA